MAGRRAEYSLPQQPPHQLAPPAAQLSTTALIRQHGQQDSPQRLLRAAGHRHQRSRVARRQHNDPVNDPEGAFLGNCGSQLGRQLLLRR